MCLCVSIFWFPRSSLRVSRLCLLCLVLFSPTGKLLNLFTCREEGDEGQNFFSSVRFAEITSSMILLAGEKMWLFKMDLWTKKKKSHLKNNPALLNLSSRQKFPLCYVHTEALDLSVHNNKCWKSQSRMTRAPWVPRIQTAEKVFIGLLWSLTMSISLIQYWESQNTISTTEVVLLATR